MSRAPHACTFKIPLSLESLYGEDSPPHRPRRFLVVPSQLPYRPPITLYLLILAGMDMSHVVTV